MKLKWTDILIIIIIFAAFSYFYSRFNLDEQAVDPVMSDPQPTEPQQPQIALTSSQHNPFTEGENTDRIDSQTTAVIEDDVIVQESALCEETPLMNRNQKFYDSIYARSLSSENNQTLFLLTGVDHKELLTRESKINQTIAEEERQALALYREGKLSYHKFWELIRNRDKRTEALREKFILDKHRERLGLLNVVYEQTNDPLYAYLIADQCAVTTKYRLCNAKQLYDLALSDSDNLAIWLMTLDLAVLEQRADLVPEIIEYAAATQNYSTHTDSLMKSIFEISTASGQSNLVAYTRAVDFKSRQYVPGISNKLTDSCENNHFACIRIGEIMEAHKQNATVSSDGMKLQMQMFEINSEQNLLEKKSEQLEAHSRQIEVMNAFYPMPNDERLFSYAIEIISMDNALDYAEAVKMEALRLLEEQPNSCIVNEPIAIQ